MRFRGEYVQNTSEPIDAVYTWVDAADDAWRERMERARQQEVGPAARLDTRRRRYRNHDELRYSLRSLERHVPWTRNIYLITDRQRPAWLRRETGRIHLVSHQEIFPDPACLPTFNSNAIEMNLHRIPGLSRRFLYLNDDFFLCRPCRQEDFLQGDHTVFYCDGLHLDERDLRPTDPGDRSCAQTLALMESWLGRRTLEWMPAHAPQLYDKEVLAELDQRFAKDFNRTRAAPFRSADDFVLRIAYGALLAARGHQIRKLRWGGRAYSFICLQGNAWRRLRDFLHISLTRPKFLCLNDDLGAGRHATAITWMLRTFLNYQFTQPTPFEVC